MRSPKLPDIQSAASELNVRGPSVCSLDDYRLLRSTSSDLSTDTLEIIVQRERRDIFDCDAAGHVLVRLVPLAELGLTFLPFVSFARKELHLKSNFAA